MNKQIASHIALIITLLAMGSRIAAAPTPTPSDKTSPTPTVSDKSKQIEDLKDRLATKVAELRQSSRRVIYGTIKSVSVSTFSVETKTKDLKIELTDEMKIFQKIKGVRTALTSDDLAKGDIVSVFGDYDETLDLLKGKVVVIQSTDPVRISGIIKETNKSDYTITIETSDKKSYVIDFETTTKTTVWNGKELEKGGFSKLTVGDTIHVTGSTVPKKENRVSATRIVNLGTDVKGAITITTPLTSPSISASPSGTKATNAPTPKATLKPTP